MRLQGTSLSNAHSASQPPSWDVCVLQSPFEPGDRPRELVVRLPKRSLSYFAETDPEYTAWIHAVGRAKNRDVRRYYHVAEVLGEGAFAQVHRGVDLSTGEEFAIKVIKKTNRDAKESENILREMVRPSITAFVSAAAKRRAATNPFYSPYAVADIPLLRALASHFLLLSFSFSCLSPPRIS